MNITYAIDGHFIGGGHRHVISLARGFQSMGFTIHIIASGEGAFTQELTRLGLNWTILPMGKLMSPYKIKRWENYFSITNSHIVHLHGGVAGFWGRWTAPRIRPFKLIHTVHGIHYIHHKNVIMKNSSLILDRILKDNTDMTICVSNADMELGNKLGILIRNKTRVIFNGIDLSQFISGASESKIDWGLPLDSIKLGLVGRLVRMKGHIYALQALNELKNVYPKLCLIFVGEGEDRVKLKTLAEKFNISNRVLFAGFRNNLGNIYKSIDIILMPSLWEGQPLTLFESFASGVPVIASDIPCVREVVENKKECLLVPPKDFEGLSMAIRKVLASGELRRKLIDNGKRILPIFDEKNMIRNTLSLYLEMIGPSEALP